MKLHSCYQDFLNFLNRPDSKADQDRVKSCHEKREDVRQIGLMLTNKESQTFNIKPIFDELMDIVCFCDGEVINHMYQYLIGLYTEGCSAITMAEVLLYGNDNKGQLMSECNYTLVLAKKTIASIYRKCQTEDCDKYIHKLTKIVSGNNIRNIKTSLQQTFPWFYFTVVLFSKDPVITYYPGEITELIVDFKGHIRKIALWSTQRSRNALGTNNTSKTGFKCENSTIL